MGLRGVDGDIIGQRRRPRHWARPQAPALTIAPEFVIAVVAAIAFQPTANA
jgi:hypothetical protein